MIGIKIKNNGKGTGEVPAGEIIIMQRYWT